MKPIILPFALLLTLTGCSERVYEPPHIVSIDPPIKTFTRDEAEALRLPPDIPTQFINIERFAYNTVTVTFSVPPEELLLNLGPLGASDYQLEGSILRLNVYCYSYSAHRINAVRREIQEILLRWKGGAQRIQLWCPTKLFLADE